MSDCLKLKNRLQINANITARRILASLKQLHHIFKNKTNNTCMQGLLMNFYLYSTNL